MTTKILSIPTCYGVREVRTLYPRNASIALLIAVLFHCMAIYSFSFLEKNSLTIGKPSTNSKNPWEKELTGYNIIPTIPGISGKSAVPKAPEMGKAVKGIPVAVPDDKVKPDQTIPDQDNYTSDPGLIFAGSGGYGSSGSVDLPSLVDEPSPDSFISVEKMPIPITQITPEYPSLARRSGVEGVVWVKILVNKDGKSKKAFVQKTDSDILNESALAAARQWMFTPAMMNSGPVAVWVSVPFRFKINR